MININGKTYKGKNITIQGDKVYIDGKLSESEDSKEINITVTGNIFSLDVDNCNTINIAGIVNDCNSKNGNIVVGGPVGGSVESKNGNIKCGNVSGNVTTKNGNIKRI